MSEPGPRRRDKYERLVSRTGEIRAIPCAVAHPCDETSLAGAIEAAKRGVIEPILVGPGRKIRGVAGEHGLDITGLPLVDTPHSHAAAAKAVELAPARPNS